MEHLIKDLSFDKIITNEWIMQNCYIAGGACVSTITGKKINDVDIYFKTKEARDLFIKRVGDIYYMSKESDLWESLNMLDRSTSDMPLIINELGYKVERDTCDSYNKHETEKVNIYEATSLIDKYVDVIKIPVELFNKQKWMFENGYDHVVIERNHFEVNGEFFFGNKSITYKKKNAYLGEEITYQFILRFYGEPKEVMDNTFDFQHCKIAYDLSAREYISSEKTYQCLANRTLDYVNSFYPISSMKRLYKYAGRGYFYNNNEFVKIIKDIHNVDTDNKYVLEDQLIGYYEDFNYSTVFSDDEYADEIWI